jgi:hypothetical protein
VADRQPQSRDHEGFCNIDPEVRPRTQTIVQILAHSSPPEKILQNHDTAERNRCKLVAVLAVEIRQQTESTAATRV